MKNTTAETKVAVYKIAKALDGISLGVALKALTAMLVASVLHSTDPKKVVDIIISSLRIAVEGVNDDNN